MADEDGVLDFPKVVITDPLVSLQRTKWQLRETGTARDAEITAVSSEAQAEILAYLKTGADPAWTEATVPKPIAGAILRRTAFLYEHRGDDADDKAGEANWNEIRRALSGFRDPALA
jgi:hypothetical protein